MAKDIEFAPIHERWMERRNRRMEAPDYPEEWRDQQCMACVWFVKLSGVLKYDYGACANAVSPFDGRVMFEHDGCEQHVHVRTQE